MSIWPGTKGQRAKQYLEACSVINVCTVQMAEGSDEEHKHPISPAVMDRFTGFSVIPLFHTALQLK